MNTFGMKWSTDCTPEYLTLIITVAKWAQMSTSTLQNLMESLHGPVLMLMRFQQRTSGQHGHSVSVVCCFRDVLWLNWTIWLLSKSLISFFSASNFDNWLYHLLPDISHPLTGCQYNQIIDEFHFINIKKIFVLISIMKMFWSTF